VGIPTAVNACTWPSAGVPNVGDPVDIPEADIAHNAIEIRLFTGVGWKKYDSQFIHLDARPGQTIITW